MSAATSSGFCPSFCSQRASFAQVVVFPEPWRPTIMMPVVWPLAAERRARARPPAAMNATSSSWQILTKTSLAATLQGLPVLALAARADDLAQRLLLHAREERLDHAELDVGLEQRQPHLAQRGLDVLLGQLRQPREAVFRGFEPFGEGIEHGCGDLAQGRPPHTAPTRQGQGECATAERQPPEVACSSASFASHSAIRARPSLSRPLGLVELARERLRFARVRSEPLLFDVRDVARDLVLERQRAPRRIDGRDACLLRGAHARVRTGERRDGLPVGLPADPSARRYRSTASASDAVSRLAVLVHAADERTPQSSATATRSALKRAVAARGWPPPPSHRAMRRAPSSPRPRPRPATMKTAGAATPPVSVTSRTAAAVPATVAAAPVLASRATWRAASLCVIDPVRTRPIACANAQLPSTSAPMPAAALMLRAICRPAALAPRRTTVLAALLSKRRPAAVAPCSSMPAPAITREASRSTVDRTAFCTATGSTRRPPASKRACAACRTEVAVNPAMMPRRASRRLRCSFISPAA